MTGKTMADAAPRSRGHLNPGDPRAVFDRFTLPSALDELVRHVWVVRWDVPKGETVDQRVLTYPAFNVVVEGAARDAVTGGLFPPTGRVSVRRLEGRGWAVGVLLRPSAGRILLDGRGVLPRAVPAEGVPLDDAPVERIADAMAQRWREPLVAALTNWLLPYAECVGERDRLVDEACRLAEMEASINRASELAARLEVAPRTLERTVREYLGLGPKWLIECRRLQAAAVTLYQEPETDLSALAAQLGYADYAHFSRRYSTVLGETPNATRRAGSAGK